MNEKEKQEIEQGLRGILEKEIKTHSEDLRGDSGQGERYENGFIAGLSYVKDFLLSPYFSSIEAEEEDTYLSSEALCEEGKRLRLK